MDLLTKTGYSFLYFGLANRLVSSVKSCLKSLKYKVRSLPHHLRASNLSGSPMNSVNQSAGLSPQSRPRTLHTDVEKQSKHQIPAQVSPVRDVQGSSTNPHLDIEKAHTLLLCSRFFQVKRTRLNSRCCTQTNSILWLFVTTK